MKDKEIMNGNKLLSSFVDSILKIINDERPSITIDFQNLKSDFDFDFFDDDISFYTKILSHFCRKDLSKIVDTITQSSEIFLRNLFQLMKYIQSLIDTNKFELLYKDPIIKLDISLIIGYLVNKYGLNTLESMEFFFVCIKELEKKNGIKSVKYNIKYDTIIKEKAKEKVKKLLLKKDVNHVDFLNDLENILLELKRYENVDIIDEIYKKYKND